ncbi:MAG: hypothetical protein RJA59_1364 [Pseudomonadota bacterium]|jgi:hypothetical protein
MPNVRKAEVESLQQLERLYRVHGDAEGLEMVRAAKDRLRWKGRTFTHLLPVAVIVLAAIDLFQIHLDGTYGLEWNAHHFWQYAHHPFWLLVGVAWVFAVLGRRAQKRLTAATHEGSI